MNSKASRKAEAVMITVEISKRDKRKKERKSTKSGKSWSSKKDQQSWQTFSYIHYGKNNSEDSNTTIKNESDESIF